LFPNISTSCCKWLSPCLELAFSCQGHLQFASFFVKTAILFLNYSFKMSNKKSTSNVPSSASTPSKRTTIKSQTAHNHPKSHAAMLNGKHHQVPSKKPVNPGNVRESSPSPERKQAHSPGQKSSLMELLFAASEKQKIQQKEPSSQPNQRSRKGTAPSVMSSSAYAGAAFDRAPTGESFPVPSFLSKTSLGSDDESLLSASCPLPAGPMTARASTDATSPVSISSLPLTKPVLKSVSIKDLLGSSSQPPQPAQSSKPSKQSQKPLSNSSSPPSKAISVATHSHAKPTDSTETGKEKDLSMLTQDLRRMLNIAK
jgi:hypothetical protein